MVVFFGVWQVVAGLVLFAAGRWGRRSVTSLVPASLPGPARRRRMRSLQRGAVLSQALGVVTLASAVVLLVFVR